MNIRVLALAALLTFPISSQALIAESAATDTRSLAERAAAKASTVVDPEELLAEINGNIQLARDGEFGKMRRNSIAQLETARNKVAKLLDGHESARELPLDEQIELYNALEMITSTLGNDDKNRVVCKRVVSLGSRVPGTECMTIAQREERARIARDGTNRAQNTYCIPGEGNPCQK